jgi:hypothetical protein
MFLANSHTMLMSDQRQLLRDKRWSIILMSLMMIAVSCLSWFPTIFYSVLLSIRRCTVVFLLSAKSGGIGLNLTGASRLVRTTFFDEMKIYKTLANAESHQIDPF